MLQKAHHAVDVLPLGQRLSRRLSWFYAGVASLAIVLVIGLIASTEYRARKTNLLHSEQLLKESLTVQLEYFEFASTAATLRQFNHILGYERIEIVDRYGMLRGATGEAEGKRPPDQQLPIIDTPSGQIGELRFWYSRRWFVFHDLYLLVPLSLLLIVFLLEMARYYVVALLREQVLLPLETLRGLIQQGVGVDKAVVISSSLSAHPEFYQIALVYRDIKDDLIQEMHEKNLEVYKRQEQSNIVQCVLSKAKIVISYLDARGKIAGRNMGVECGTAIQTIMELEDFSYQTVAKVLEAQGAKVTQLPAYQASERGLVGYTLEVEDVLDSYWTVSLIHLHDGGRALLAQNDTELKKAELQIRQSQKMEALGQLANGIAHDFNNLLAIILGSLEQMRFFAEQPGFDRDVVVGRAIMATERASDVVGSLLAYGRKSALKQSQVAPKSLFQSLSRLLHSGAKPELQIRFNIETEQCVYVDKGLLESALINLVVNADHAMAGRGLIMLTYRLATAFECQAAGFAPTGAGVAITVRDYGTGIPKYLIDKVCDPFFTTKAKQGGSGLGLSMVAGFVKQSGGSLSLENCQPGLLVRMVFPLMQNAHSVEKTTIPLLPAMTVFPRILLVEDNSTLLDTYASLFRSWGAQVRAVGTIAEAMQQLAIDSVQVFDVLVTDLNLSDGLSTALWPQFKVKSGLGKVILMTGNIRVAEIEVTATFNQVDYILQKPIKLEHLLDIVKSTMVRAFST